MDFLANFYFITGAAYAGYMLGTLYKEPNPLWFLLLMWLVYAAMWPYFFVLTLRIWFKSAQKNGGA